MEGILNILPDKLTPLVKQELNKKSLQEIRLRLNQPIEFIFEDNITYTPYSVGKSDFSQMINLLSEHSFYRLANELKEGFITIQGGHRVGIAGEVITKNGKVHSIKHISSLNIRVARERINVAEPLIPHLYKDQILNTLVIGPPQSGKTTYLRDIIRIISTGWRHVKAKKIALIDERSEIAASKNGIPQHNIGKRTDVMDACPKAEGMMMMIRSMSPEVIVVDEIGSKEDVFAILEAIHAGVSIICSVHGHSLDELKNRPSLQKLFKYNVFERFIILNRTVESHHHFVILNEQENNLLKKRGV